MSKYRLRASEFLEVTAEYGDHDAASIARRAGLGRTVVWKALNHVGEPSTGTLMRLYACYGVPIHELLYVPDGNGDSTEEAAA